jgi:hypothetical protein
MQKITREPSRVNAAIRDDRFTSVFLPVGRLREELRLRASTHWIERPAGPPASAHLQQRGRVGALLACRLVHEGGVA